MCDVLSYRSDHLFRPFLAKNEKYQNNMYRKKNQDSLNVFSLP